MRRCNENVISPPFVFFLTFVMIFNVVSCYRTTWHYDKNTVIEEDSDSNEIEMNSSVFINRLLKTSPSALKLTDERHHGLDVKSAAKMNVPVTRSLDHRRLPHNSIHSPERVQDCSKLIQEIVIRPRESINDKDQPKLLVNLPQYNFGPTARECRGPETCRDHTTPEQKVYGCVQAYKLEIVDIFNTVTHKSIKQKMMVPNGCKCGLHDL